MTEIATNETATAPVPDGGGVAEQAIAVEFITNTHRLTCEIRYHGPPRRVVDILNSIDGPYITVHEGCVIDGEETSQFDVGQVRRDAIMLAIPRSGAAPPASSLEAVRKVPVPATAVLTGYQVEGNAFLIPGVEPAEAPILTSKHFVPFTDARLTPAGGGEPREEPLIIVNLARTELFAFHPRRG